MPNSFARRNGYKLQESIDRAAADSSLLIQPGEYLGTITIRKPLKLVGASRSKPALGGCDGPAIVIWSEGVQLRDLYVGTAKRDHDGTVLLVREDCDHDQLLSGVELDGRKASIKEEESFEIGYFIPNQRTDFYLAIDVHAPSLVRLASPASWLDVEWPIYLPNNGNWLLRLPCRLTAHDEIAFAQLSLYEGTIKRKIFLSADLLWDSESLIVSETLALYVNEDIVIYFDDGLLIDNAVLRWLGAPLEESVKLLVLRNQGNAWTVAAPWGLANSMQVVGKELGRGRQYLIDGPIHIQAAGKLLKVKAPAAMPGFSVSPSLVEFGKWDGDTIVAQTLVKGVIHEALDVRTMVDWLELADVTTTDAGVMISLATNSAVRQLQSGLWTEWSAVLVMIGKEAIAVTATINKPNPPVEIEGLLDEEPEFQREPRVQQDTSTPSRGDYYPTPIIEEVPSPKQLPDSIDAPLPPGFELIRLGAFRFGMDNQIREIRAPFLVAKYPVTNSEYLRFVQAQGPAYAPRHWRSLADGSYDFGVEREDHAVQGVSRIDAEAFCRWAGTGFRLLTEEEWERVARYIDGRRFPWGNNLDPNQLRSYMNHGLSTAPVDRFEKATSEEGVYALLGNLWEWTSSEEEGLGILKGGYFRTNTTELHAAMRMKRKPNYRNSNCGFRCARDAI